MEMELDVEHWGTEAMGGLHRSIHFHFQRRMHSLGDIPTVGSGAIAQASAPRAGRIWDSQYPSRLRDVTNHGREREEARVTPRRYMSSMYPTRELQGPRY